MKTLIGFYFLLSTFAFASSYDDALALAPTCAGYRVENACAPFARDFAKRFKGQGVKVHFAQTYHGETIRHVAVMFREGNQWWYVDNMTGPVRAGGKTWNDRIDNALCNSNSCLSYATAHDLIAHGFAGLGSMPPICGGVRSICGDAWVSY